MVIGATVFAVLILLLLLAEKGSGMLWRSGGDDVFFYCTPCDLRYPVHELDNPHDRVCPRGHLVKPVAQEFPFGTLFICLCVVFILAGLVLILTGLAPTA